MENQPEPRQGDKSEPEQRNARKRRLAWEEREVRAAAAAAAAIGGRAGDEDVDPAERPLQEAGEGEAEGFELAEQDLIDAAERGVSSASLFLAALSAESEEPLEVSYGDADHELSSELPADDR